MKLGLSLETSLHQSLTPQQIQYLKMLQLSTLQFEQHVRTELENNPMLEERREDDGDYGEGAEGAADVGNITESQAQSAERRADEQVQRDDRRMMDGPPSGSQDSERQEGGQSEGEPTDAFEFYKLIWGEDPSNGKSNDTRAGDDDDDDSEFQFKEVPTLEEELLDQLRFLPMAVHERAFGEYVIGNVDDDGYLRRDLRELLDEFNGMAAEHNLAIQAPALLGMMRNGFDSARIPGIEEVLEPLSLGQAEGVLKRIQALDPPGFGSRTVQECLVAQLRALPKLNASQKLAYEVLTKTYEAFAMKHFHVIEKTLDVTEDYLREAIEVIRNLNPRPGGGTFGPDVNTVVPDFIVERTDDHTDFLITVNDSRLPVLRVSNAYERLKKEARFHKFNKDTRDWLRKKYEDAKFLLQAIRQRKATMLRVMTAIVGLQREFFERGTEGLRPLIYRDVAEVTGLDISTVCRIVNGKYVLTDYGTFELKFFFSESLINDDGEEISTRIVKQKIKEMIDAESKAKPLSDDKLAKDLKTLGYNVARRTVAKYREQLKIPVARLRKEL
ncbi:MAG TPA: RNA polymerase factor sigma-54 [Chlorobiota bacterium]|nr:RNA polymerase factor sigma-54 [Chlorobiota bacterium]